MKKLIFITTIFLLTASCETAKDVKEDINKLRQERIGLQQDVEKLDINIQNKNKKISDQTEELKKLGILKEGKNPKFIVKFHLKQSHFTLDIEEHMRDAMNAIDFEMPVDEDYYKSLSVGQKVVDDFRVGSLILNGSFGDWEMSVSSKRIEKSEK